MDFQEYLILDQAILGAPTDEATAYTVYGVRKYVDTTAKNTLLGASGDAWPTKHTIYGVVKYSDTKNADLKKILIGASTDASTADTIYGAKKYTDTKIAKLQTRVDALEAALSTLAQNVGSLVTIANG